jgi:hypothetical protein
MGHLADLRLLAAQGLELRLVVFEYLGYFLVFVSEDGQLFLLHSPYLLLECLLELGLLDVLVPELLILLGERLLLLLALLLEVLLLLLDELDLLIDFLVVLVILDVETVVQLLDLP